MTSEPPRPTIRAYRTPRPPDALPCAPSLAEVTLYGEHEATRRMAEANAAIRAVWKTEHELETARIEANADAETTAMFEKLRDEAEARYEAEWAAKHPDDPWARRDLVEPTGEPNGWEPVDLTPYLDGTHEPLRPSVWPRTDGVCLFYAGRVNDLHGEQGNGKSFAAQAALAAELAAGNVAMLVDWEDHAPGIVTRLLALGSAREAIRERFIYRHPDQIAGLEALAQLEADARRCSLVVFDSTGESMAAERLDGNKDPEVLAWANMLPRRCARAGAAVVIIDHVVKDADTRGLSAIGSQRKGAMIDGATYRVDTLKGFSTTISGLLRLVCAKDRNGTFAKGQVAAEITVDVGDGTIHLTPKPSLSVAEREAGGGIIHTVLAERVSRWLEIQGEPQSANTIEQTVSGKGSAKRAALGELVLAGYITERSAPGQRGSLYSSKKPFREADLSAPAEGESVPESVPPSPSQSVPESVPQTCRSEQVRPESVPVRPDHPEQSPSQSVPNPPYGGDRRDGLPAPPIDLFADLETPPPNPAYHPEDEPF